MTFGSFRLNTVSAVSAAVASSITATGGDVVNYITASGVTYKLHQFTTSGAKSFVVSATTGTPTVDVLLVGAGGHGYSASNSGGGGGGGGQVRYQTGVSVSTGTYSLSIAGTTAQNGTPASTTGFGFTAIGGDNGVSQTGGTSGNGIVAGTASGINAATGGAGAGAASLAASTGSTAGGAGITNSITGASVAYGGGGGAACANSTSQSNGVDGGGNGSRAIGGATGGANNTGGGGGGSSYPGGNVSVGTGGSGVCYIRYATPSPYTFTYITNSTSTTSTITVPATAQAGDIAYLVDMSYNASTTAPTTVTPTGWTAMNSSVNQTTTPACRGNTWYKILSSGDVGATVTGMSGTSSTQKMIMIYRPSLTPNASTYNGGSQQATAAVPTNQTLSLTNWGGYQPWGVGFAIYSSSGTITTRGSTVTASRELNVGTTLYVKTFEWTDGTQPFTLDSTISMADYGSNMLMSGTFSAA